MRSSHLLVLPLLALLVLPREAAGGFYSYTDEQGNLHFVDDPGKIPDKYRQRTRVHEADISKPPPDKLPPPRRVDEPADEKPREKDRLAKTSQEIRILGERTVLVPVVFGYRNRRVRAWLILDTGATTTLLHRKVADALKIDLDDLETVHGRVADGRRIAIRRGHMDVVQVGPILKRDLEVSVLEQPNKAPYHGLLGMDFLEGLSYRIDLSAQRIHWTFQP
ncbi:MAG: clan AA aspartic protease [Deltaproteobacteria bacterium]|nr:clan AA aspartic protease [Deltaproteobacteria bacterium]